MTMFHEDGAELARKLLHERMHCKMQINKAKGVDITRVRYYEGRLSLVETILDWLHRRNYDIR